MIDGIVLALVSGMGYERVADEACSATTIRLRRDERKRTNSWMNNFGKLRRNTERHRTRTEFCLALATVIVTVRGLTLRAWYTHRWHTRPTNPRIR